MAQEDLHKSNLLTRAGMRHMHTTNHEYSYCRICGLTFGSAGPNCSPLSQDTTHRIVMEHIADLPLNLGLHLGNSPRMCLWAKRDTQQS